MPTGPANRPSCVRPLRSALPAVLALLAALVPAAAQATPEAPLRAAGVPEVVVDTYSVEELAVAAREVPLGGRLFVSGIELEAGAAPESLELERFRVAAPDARIVVHGADGEELLPVPDHAYFRGRVAGDAASLAVLSVRAGEGGAAGEVRGVVQREGRLWAVGAGAGPDFAGGSTVAPRPLAAREATALPGTSEPFSCGQSELPPVPRPDLPTAPNALSSAALTTTPHTALVAVETDWEFYLKFGNVDDAVAYVLDLFAYSSSLYDQEIHTNLLVSYVSLWTSAADPWSQTSPSCGFYEFGRYWNDNRTDVSRALAHFVSGKNNGGGIAWLGVLCNGPFNVNLGSACPGLSPSISNYGGDYGYSGDIDGNFDLDNPSTVWDWIVVSHEIGHNFNSPHTHCYNGLGGSSDPVDECFSGEPGCYSGSTSLPCGSAGAGCGTIMSYCHLRAGGLANISPTFGTGHPHGVLPQRVPDRMRSHVEAVASFSSCLDRFDCFELTVGFSGLGLPPTALPTASAGCEPGSYLPGEIVTLTGLPDLGQRVGSWTGTDDDASGWLVNTVTMPAADHAASANYQAGCDDLVLDSGTDNDTETYDACGEITAGTTYRVGGTGAVTLRSYQRVVLTDGFRVESGGSLAVVVP